MDERKRKALEKLGGRVTTVGEFLDLTPAEEALIELKLQLVREVRERRQAKGMTQEALAQAIQSSQSRVAKMESGDPQASIEFLLRAVMALGGAPSFKVVNAPSRGPVRTRQATKSPRAAARGRELAGRSPSRAATARQAVR